MVRVVTAILVSLVGVLTMVKLVRYGWSSG